MKPSESTATAAGLQRLHGIKLRPTVPRLTVLQVLEEASHHALGAEDVLRRAALRGTPVGLGTVYRVLHQFEQRGLLLREWSHHRRKALYRLRPEGAQEPPLLYMACRHSGHRVRVTDPLLHERLQAAASHLGFSLAGRRVLIEVDAAEAGR